MYRDRFLYDVWMEYIKIKDVNTYCLIKNDNEHHYPLCERCIKNFSYVDSKTLINGIKNLFPIRYTKKRSVLSQRMAWGNLAGHEAVALVTDEETYRIIYILGIDQGSNEIIYFDRNAEKQHDPQSGGAAVLKESRLHNEFDLQIYAAASERLEKVLFAVIINAELTCKLGLEIDVLYDERENFQEDTGQKGLSLFEAWFSNSVIFHRPVQCIVNADEYVMDDILIAEPALTRPFLDKLVYSTGEHMASIVFQYFSSDRDERMTESITCMVKDKFVSHAISITGTDTEHDLILYMDPNENNLLTPQYMPKLQQGGFVYKNSNAILRSQFEAIAYAILMPDFNRF